MTDVAVGGLESAAPPKGAEDNRFPLFDGFRAIAALAVLLTHVSFITGTNESSDLFGPYLARMDAGVAIFFLISGFLLYRPFVLAHLSDRPAPRVLPYLWRRALRIFPAYWLAMTVAVYAFGIGNVPDVRAFFAYYSLTHIYDLRYVIAPLAQSWTLATEIAFYLFLPVWAALLRLLRGSPDRRFRLEVGGCLLLVVTGIAFRAGVYSIDTDDPHTGMLLTWLPAWLDLFAMGMLLAVVKARMAQTGGRAPLGLDGPWLPAVSWILAAVTFWAVSTRAGLPLMSIQYTASEDMAKKLLYGATAFFLLLPGVFGPQDRGVIRALLRNRLLQAAGIVSYGIYLWHEPWIDRVLEWRNLEVFNGGFWSMLVPVTFLTVAAAAVSYLVVEKPALRLKEAPARRARAKSRRP